MAEKSFLKKQEKNWGLPLLWQECIVELCGWCVRCFSVCGCTRHSTSCVLLRLSLTDRQRSHASCWRGSAAHTWVPVLFTLTLPSFWTLRKCRSHHSKVRGLYDFLGKEMNAYLRLLVIQRQIHIKLIKSEIILKCITAVTELLSSFQHR